MTHNESGISNEEMVAAMKEGQMEYFEPLFYRFSPLIKKYMKDYFLEYVEFEDLMQEARLVMLDAVERYDSEKGMRFSGYYRLVLQHHIYGIIRKENAYRRKSDRRAVSFDQLLETSHSVQMKFVDFQTPEYLLTLRESYEDYVALLSSFEKEVYLLFIRGLSIKSIASNLNVEYVRVKNALERCRQKFNAIS
ncbi:sigma-70 family RNA polymerase sigma factor [Jeotgalibaca porci]|uniref:RNA polymerase sigma factor SigS n=1 Tax=Jeotgalibaca porci TaxID=1868793 RepID=A0A6G7WHL1_9LACT|nr:sigma-70 family RNA polymerase sigma factor [Jeotgalibaca porci]QIK51709.1 sigma-70 family RNA polymerase sigma factor [Jeotgalibaca porci]